MIGDIPEHRTSSIEYYNCCGNMPAGMALTRLDRPCVVAPGRSQSDQELEAAAYRLNAQHYWRHE